MNRSGFFAADLGRCQDEIEQALWEFLIDHHGVDRKTLIRCCEEAIENVEYQLGVSA